MSREKPTGGLAGSHVKEPAEEEVEKVRREIIARIKEIRRKRQEIRSMIARLNAGLDRLDEETYELAERAEKYGLRYPDLAEAADR